MNILCFFWLKIICGTFFPSVHMSRHCDLQYTLGLIYRQKLKMNGLFWWALEISYEWHTTWWYFTASLYFWLEQLEACQFMINIKLGWAPKLYIPSTLNIDLHTIECVCSKMLNHGLNHEFFLSLFKLIPCPIHWIVCVLAYLNIIFEFKAVLELPKTASSAQTHICISFI